MNGTRLALGAVALLAAAAAVNKRRGSKAWDPRVERYDDASPEDHEEYDYVYEVSAQGQWGTTTTHDQSEDWLVFTDDEDFDENAAWSLMRSYMQGREWLGSAPQMQFTVTDVSVSRQREPHRRRSIRDQR